MFKQYVSQFFCYLTILLLSSNIAFSSIPVHHLHKSNLENQQKKVSFDVDIHENVTFVTEKDPFEDVVGVFLKPDFTQLIWAHQTYDFQPLQLVELSGSKYVQIPIWLLFRTILQ